MSQKFAAYDAQGNIIGFYDDVDSPVPDGVTTVIKITDAEWQACLCTSGHTVVGGALVGPTAAQLLSQAQSAQCSALNMAYNTAIQKPVSYMGTTFQADSGSQDTLTKSLVPGAVPAGFFWLDANNAHVAMTFPQLQGLAMAMLAQGQAAFAKLQVYKTAVRAATTVAAVQAIVWA
ncbi:DUF4376 domain-containing protein [Cupriavidus basilensis]|uniref:DUF4376 domain-containing protein n=1 Tax=Cupriavidus basilensis TaxID=68895 RepID=UPI0039F6A4B8